MLHYSCNNIVCAIFLIFKIELLFQKKTHYEGLMNNRVVSLIKEAEAHYQELEKNRVVRLMLWIISMMLWTLPPPQKRKIL